MERRRPGPYDQDGEGEAPRTALVCVTLADRQQARRVHDLLLPYENLMANTESNFWGAVAHHLGILATTMEVLDEAERHYTEAEAAYVRLEAPVWMGRTRLDRGRMLLTRRQPGDVERARELLGQALTTARDLGLTNMERRAVLLLEDCS